MNKSLNKWYTCYGKHKLEEWKYNDAVYPSGLDRDEWWSLLRIRYRYRFAVANQHKGWILVHVEDQSPEGLVVGIAVRQALPQVTSLSSDPDERIPQYARLTRLLDLYIPRIGTSRMRSQSRGSDRVCEKIRASGEVFEQGLSCPRNQGVSKLSWGTGCIDLENPGPRSSKHNGWLYHARPRLSKRVVSFARRKAGDQFSSNHSLRSRSKFTGHKQ